MLGNAHAVAILWPTFIDELRFRYWDSSALVPRMADGTPAQNSCQHGDSKSNAAADGTHSGHMGSDIADARPGRNLAGSDPASPQVNQSAAASHSNRSQNDCAASSGHSSGRSAPAAEGARNASSVKDSESQASSSGWKVLGGPSRPDLSASLLHQKLQMLNVCIFRGSVGGSAVRSHLVHNAADTQAVQQYAEAHGDGASSVGGGSTYHTPANSGGANNLDPGQKPLGSSPASSGGANSNLISPGQQPGSSSRASRSLLSDAADCQATDASQSTASSAVKRDAGSQALKSVPLAAMSPCSARAENDDDPDGGYASAREDYDDWDPQGVQDVVPGRGLMSHPDRPLRIPNTQVRSC